MVSLITLFVACDAYQEKCAKINLITNERDEKMNKMDLSVFDLREFHEEIGRSTFDMITEKFPEYPFICRMVDFKIKESYAGFAIANIDILDERRIIIRFRLKSNESEDGVDADVFMHFHDSQLESIEGMRRFLLGFAAPPPAVFASQLDIGDLVINGLAITFIRGNVNVDVRRRVLRDMNIDIIDLAKEIDQQILDVITGE